MTRRDPNTHDLNQATLRIADDVLVWPVRERGEWVYRLEIPKLHRFFRVGFNEYVFISLLDGNTTLPQACGMAAAKLGSDALTSTQAATTARWLLTNKIAHLNSEPPPTRSGSVNEANQQHPVRAMFGRINPFWIKVPLARAQPWIDSLARLGSPLLVWQLVMLGCLLIVSAIIGLAFHWSEFTTQSANLFHPSNWFWLLGTWLVLKLIHEWGHAVACHRHGGTVHESGLAFVLFAPMAYVDVTRCWRMASRWSRIAVAAAGMYVELLVAAAAFWGWMLVDDPQLRFLCRNVVFSAGISTLLFNANILMRFDGYFILADLIEIPNLASEASMWLRRVCNGILSGEPVPPSELVGWRRTVVSLYAVAALLWRVVICVSLAIAASTMFAGAGIALAAIGIGIWLGGPLMQLWRYMSDLKNADPFRFMRAAVVGSSGLLMFLGILFWIPIPSALRVPAVANYLPETMVRARVSGFVKNVHVVDGVLVRRGDLLLELENRELINRIEQLQLTWSQNDVRLRQATDQHDAGARQILQENQHAVASQIQQLSRQTSELQVVAPRDGRVIAHGLDALVGTYFDEGDTIMVVASEADKEIVAIVDQERVEDVRPLVGNALTIRTADFRTFTGRLDRIEPRATDRLAEVSLAATEGGPLPVQWAGEASDSGDPRLLQPHFRSRIVLEPEVAIQVPAGMRLSASFGYHTASLADRLTQMIRKVWHTAQREATID